MSRYIDLLSSLPKSKRDVAKRAANKTPEIIIEAKKFGKEYFDGDRKYGYGGYVYDGRNLQVARDIIKFFNLKIGDTVLDVGCGKGFLVHDLCIEGMNAEGMDISSYAIENSLESIRYKLKQGNARDLPYGTKSFDAVISINTLHNLPREGVIRALGEIERVSRGHSYVVVDSYYNQEQKLEFQKWCLTAETHMYPQEWIALFKEAGYTGAYSWNVL